MARWITGLPKHTKGEDLLRCAHLPPLHASMDYLLRQYAIWTLFLPSNHALYPQPHSNT
jgi:hypothetical protein